ncbi:hypothetical protein ACFYP4_02590 [Streptomyces sp. NPDC005551]|uniref:hypothetical protein n=1 Tax=Streptomyces sp. NPDC005551 TaxID=3364725 RepID=UPI00369D0198
MPPRKRAGDLTGIKTQELQAKHAEELAEKAGQLTMLQAAATAEKLQPVDLTGGDRAVVQEGDVQVEVKRAKKRVKAMADVECTVGVGNNYNLEEGRTYDLPLHVAEHLLEKGLVWA